MSARAGVVALLVGVAPRGGVCLRIERYAVDSVRTVATGDPTYALDQLRHNYGEVGGAATTLEDSSRTITSSWVTPARSRPTPTRS